MMGLFGKMRDNSKGKDRPAQPAPQKAAQAVPKPAPPKANDTAVLKDELEKKIRMLDKRADKLTQQVDAEMDKAKEFTIAGDQRRAKDCLRRKKGYESQLERNSVMMRKYEQQLNLIDETATTKAAMEDLAKANEHLDKLQIEPERAEDIMEKMTDNYMKQQEITDILQQETGEIFDEEGELEELQKMIEADKAKEALAAAPPVGTAPGATVPSTKAPAASSSAKVAKDDVDDELAKLEREMQIGM